MSIIERENQFDIFEKRMNTDSTKFDFSKKMQKPDGLIPLWVADMDFMAPVEIRDALMKRVEHGIFGYSDAREDYFSAVKKWFSEGFEYEIDSEWIVLTPGIVFAIATAIKAFTEFGDSILIQPPVYHPFADCIKRNERRVVLNPLKYVNGGYHIDFTDFENKIISEEVKMFILCSPHNPIGRVWTREELGKLSQICKKHKVLILSDEIHADFIYDGYKHHMLATVTPEFSDTIITFTSPSKTFNIAGLQISNCFISNPKLRHLFKEELIRIGYHNPNPMGLEACKAAYTYGRPWLTDLKIYLAENIQIIKEAIEAELPEVKIVNPEGTYLLWLDFNALNLNPHELDRIIQDKAKLWLVSGTLFGYGGEGFMRVNIATHKDVIKRAVTQLIQAFKG